MTNQEVNFLEEGPPNDFKGATLQIRDDGFHAGKVNTGLIQNMNADSSGTLDANNANITNQNVANEEKKSPTEGRRFEGSIVPWSGEDARDYFSQRDDVVQKAVKECADQLVTLDDGELMGSWLLTEISLWDNEKERLILLTSKYVITVKYDFIALRTQDVRKVPLERIDTLVIGELSYPPSSLIPSRNVRGVRAMWNQGEPLPITKKWNPFSNNIPWNTYTSHPLLWHKVGDERERSMYNVDDFAYRLVQAVERSGRAVPCNVQHRPIILENYIGLGALIHNKNALGFYKVRGKFSF